MQPPLQLVKKASQSSPPAGGEKIQIIFCRGVYLAENTSQAASVRVVHRRCTRSARSRLLAFCQKSPQGFLTVSEGEALMRFPLKIYLQTSVMVPPPTTRSS